MKPRILLSVELNKEHYIDAIEKAGGTPVAEYCPEVDLSYDGLLLCGGRDVDPQRYGEEINGAINIDYARDAAEMALAEAYIAAGKPVLGVCRGCQLLNVYFGGSLYQHLDTAPHHRSATDVDAIHTADTVTDSVIRKLYGDHFMINSVHHEGVKVLGKDLIVTHVSDDGVAEGFEHKSLPVFAVQWHPERLINLESTEIVDGLKIFEHFISLCK